MKRPILSLCALGLAVACGSEFVGDEAGAGGGGSGNTSGGGSAGNASSGGRAGNAGSNSGGTGDNPGAGGSGVEPPIGSAGETVIGSGGDGTIGSGGRPMGMGGEPVTGIGGGMVVTSCETLIDKYVTEIDKARDCNQDSPEPECDASWVFQMPCDCAAAVNSLSANIDLIYNLMAEMQTNGCMLAVCDPPCPVIQGICGPAPIGDRHICQ